MHPGAFGTAFHALVEASSPDRLSLPAYQSCLGAVQVFVARQAKKVRLLEQCDAVCSRTHLQPYGLGPT